MVQDGASQERRRRYHFPWAEAFPLLIAGCVVLSLSIILWTYSPHSSTRERLMWVVLATLLAGLSIWGLTALRANEVIE